MFNSQETWELRQRRGKTQPQQQQQQRVAIHGLHWHLNQPVDMLNKCSRKT